MKPCLKCGKPLTKPATGRPPSYCSRGCRRSAEHEIRRINRYIERLEIEGEGLRNSRNKLGDWLGRSHRQQVNDNRKALAEKETRLRELLEEAEQ